MDYEIHKTEEFDEWISNLNDRVNKGRILSHISRMEKGNFGDSEPVGEGVSELRLFFGPGFRVYYVIRDCRIVLLLVGGSKRGQKRDIKKAKSILSEVK